ncbi:MFS transporter, DHA1 family, multidrug resistance protein [Succinivibrio dextrinosolvens]|uniref:MFS transporter n=1 Tax=Succinivibrio dextrinosolvens TaxID=83771 RepID=UPI0008F29B07|nr:MFS transporter [Succinivibrio dextrinosolvens]SFS81280.1 MFS transporter, DHA1 family, multidrug resistance protein [Succinivibrio dextrinosolvens]
MDKALFTLILLYANVFVISASNTLVLPFLPVYLKQDLGAESSDLALYTTLCYSITFVVNIFISPVWGHFADKFGRKKMLIRVSFILFLSYLCAYLATSPLILCIARAVQGFACGMMPAIMAFTSSLSTDHKKTQLRIGYVQSINLLGTIIGPAVGGVMAEFFGVRESYLCIFILIAVVCLINILLLKEPPVHEHQNSISEILPLSEILKDPIIVSLCCCIVVNSAVIMMVVPMLADYVDSMTTFNEPLALSGIIFSLSGIAGVLAAPLWSRFGSEKGFLKVLMLSTLGAAVAYMLQYQMSSILMFSIMQFVFGLCICATIPAANSITAKHINHQNQTKAFSVLYSASQCGNILGPVFSAVIIMLIGERAVFALASALLFTIFSYLFMVNRIRQNDKKAS